MKTNIFQTFYSFSDFILEKTTDTNKFVKFIYHRDKEKSINCPRCGHKMGKNRTVIREVYDLPLGSFISVRLRFETVQGKCSRCETFKTFLPDEIGEKATATRRFQKLISNLCYEMSPIDVSRIFPLSDDTVRRWDQNIREEDFGKVKLGNVQQLLINEKLLGKHYCVTLALNGQTGELLYVKPGKDTDALAPFFAQMTAKQRRNIKTVCMNRNTSYSKVVKNFCPNAIVNYNQFQIEKNL